MAALTTGVPPEAKHNLPHQISGSRFPTTFAGKFVPGLGRLEGWGTTVPPDAETGWAKSAIFHHTDGSGGDDLIYQNNGTLTSCAFIAITSVAGADFGSTGILSDVVLESTSAAGVTLDSVVLKDGGITTSTTPNVMAGGDKTLAIVVADANYTVLAVNSGKIHHVANVSADRTFTLPTAAAGLYYEFWSTVIAADGHDWLIVTGSDTNFYLGGVLFVDSDAADTLLAVPNGTDDATIQIILPSVGCCVKMYCDGTNWFLNGIVFSTTIPTYT